MAAEPSIRTSGIDLEYVDSSVRPQDDFFQYFNGKWLATAEIPADRSSTGSFLKVYENTQSQLRAIIEAAAQDAHAVAGSDEQKIGDLYASFMDEKTLDQLGLKPLAKELAGIAALKDKRQIPATDRASERVEREYRVPLDDPSGRTRFNQVHR